MNRLATPQVIGDVAHQYAVRLEGHQTVEMEDAREWCRLREIPCRKWWRPSTNESCTCNSRSTTKKSRASTDNGRRGWSSVSIEFKLRRPGHRTTERPSRKWQRRSTKWARRIHIFIRRPKCRGRTRAVSLNSQSNAILMTTRRRKNRPSVISRKIIQACNNQSAHQTIQQ